MSTTVEISRTIQALRQSGHPALRRLSVEETDEVIVITGRVRSYYLKQVAQETIMPVRGHRQVHNHVQVVRE